MTTETTETITRAAVEAKIDENLERLTSETKMSLHACIVALESEDDDAVLGHLLDAIVALGERQGMSNLAYELFASGDLPAGTEGNGS